MPVRNHIKGLIGILILSAAVLSGCRSGSSASSGVCPKDNYCSLNSVAYGAGLFVAVGATGAKSSSGSEPWVEVSTDGIDWKSEDIRYTSPKTYPVPELQSITYGKEGFVTTDGVHVLHSADGLNWDVDSLESASDKISYVIYDGTRYVLYSNTTGQYGGADGRIDNFPWKVSTNGVDWTDYGSITVTNGPAGEPISIIHEAGMYEAAWQAAASVTASTRYLTATSKDGLSWTLGNPVTVTYLQVPPTAPPTPVVPAMYGILHTGDQYLVFGGTDEFPAEDDSWGVALHGSSMSTLTMTSSLTTQNGFHPAGEPLSIGNPYAANALVSNGTVTVGLGEGGLFVSTDGATWKFESLESVVTETGCRDMYPGAPTCTDFDAGAAAPGGSIVVLVADGNGSGVNAAETTDGIHWVKSNL